MKTFRYSKFKTFQGRGGPTVEVPKEQKTRTRSGRYVVGVIAKHRSSSRWAWSTVLWGTPVREEKGVVQIQENGRWINLSSKPGFKGVKESDILNSIIEYYQSFKADLGPALTPAEKAQRIPKTWIFNDFGHLSIKYFRDTNRNYRRDKGESFISDFIHTVPKEEYFNSFGKTLPLEDSHGCIHVHPNDIDTIIAYIKIGSVIQIHPYTETTVPAGFDSKEGRPPYELHFFPFIDVKSGASAGNLILYKVKAVE